MGLEGREVTIPKGWGGFPRLGGKVISKKGGVPRVGVNWGPPIRGEGVNPLGEFWGGALHPLLKNRGINRSGQPFLVVRTRSRVWGHKTVV